MINNFMETTFVSLVFILMAQSSWCVSTLQGKEEWSQNTQRALPKVTCSVRGIKAEFGPMVRNNSHVRGVSGARIPLVDSNGSCGMRVGKDRNQNLVFFSRYDSCYARMEGSEVVLPSSVQSTGENQWIRVNVSCPSIRRSSPRTKPTSCSSDGHFVFTVKTTDTYPAIDPSSLRVKDQPECLPVVSTAHMAIFKIGVMDCGAKMKKRGDSVMYEVEVEEQNKERRHSPFSLQVECEYDESDLIRAKDSRSLYAVTNPPAVVAQGTIRVQMRLATDASFTTFVPEDQLPLTLPSRETVNVEISIVPPSPDPTLSIRVRDCFAYPVSKRSVWTLLHDGCPNPLDDMRSSVPVDNQGKTTAHSQVRRFDVKTFAFLDPDTGKASVEKMYFYCWVEICTDDVDCAQRCTIISSDTERQRRQAVHTSHQVQLVTLGPLQLVQNGTKSDDLQSKKASEGNSSNKTKRHANHSRTVTRVVSCFPVFRVMVYAVLGVGAVLSSIPSFVLWSNIQRCQRTEGRRTRSP